MASVLSALSSTLLSMCKKTCASAYVAHIKSTNWSASSFQEDQSRLDRDLVDNFVDLCQTLS